MAQLLNGIYKHPEGNKHTLYYSYDETFYDHINWYTTNVGHCGDGNLLPLNIYILYLPFWSIKFAPIYLILIQNIFSIVSGNVDEKE